MLYSAIFMHLFHVLYSRLDVNLPRRQAGMSRVHVHESMKQMEIMNVDKVVSMTTYPQLVGDTRLPNTDLTECWPPTVS